MPARSPARFVLQLLDRNPPVQLQTTVLAVEVLVEQFSRLEFDLTDVAAVVMVGQRSSFFLKGAWRVSLVDDVLTENRRSETHGQSIEVQKSGMVYDEFRENGERNRN